jgi:hypothetical protein
LGCEIDQADGAGAPIRPEYDVGGRFLGSQADAHDYAHIEGLVI